MLHSTERGLRRKKIFFAEVAGYPIFTTSLLVSYVILAKDIVNLESFVVEIWYCSLILPDVF